MDKEDLNCILGIIFIFVLGAIFYIGAKPYFAELSKIKAAREEFQTEVKNLASLDYTTNLEGGFHSSFTIGRGYIDTVDYYVAYEVLDDGGKRLIKFPAKITIIYDNLYEDEKAYAEIDQNYYSVKNVRLYVPKNTITQEYNLSLD